MAFCHSKFRCKNTIFFAVVIQFSLRLEACQLALPWHVNIWQFQKNVACFFFVFNSPSQRSVSSRNQFFVLYLEWRNGIIFFWSKGTIFNLCSMNSKLWSIHKIKHQFWGGRGTILGNFWKKKIKWPWFLNWSNKEF